MKVQLTMDNFPMLLLNMMIKDISKKIDNIDIQVGGEDTVYVTFASDDICKVQEVSILCDRYYFNGGVGDGSSLLLRDGE